MAGVADNIKQKFQRLNKLSGILLRGMLSLDSLLVDCHVQVRHDDAKHGLGAMT